MKSPGIKKVTQYTLLISCLAIISQFTGVYSQDQLPQLNFSDPILYLKLAGALVLMCLSGLFSGLTLGLLGLDLNSLEIVHNSDPNPKQRKYAKRIIPVRARGNLLLCTLLLGNVMVNAAFSILTSDLTSGILGFFISSGLIVVFGEIAPQATCSRYALPIGAHTLWIVYIFIFLLYPVAHPLSYILDVILGAELGTLYNNEGLKELIKLHARSKETELVLDSANILRGAIDFSDKTVKQIMTTLPNCFMLDISNNLDMDVLNQIWQTGHSRIPVYDRSKDNIVGLLFTKDLLLINPEHEYKLATVLTFYGREVLRVSPDTHLNKILAMFKTGKSHIAIVHEADDDGNYRTTGLVTLEDVIEEIIKDEIVDETDVFKTNTHEQVVGQRDRFKFNMFFRRGKSRRLAPEQVIAVASYLLKSIPKFQHFPENHLQQLLSHAELVNTNDKKEEVIYKRGKQEDFFTLVLSGKMDVVVGIDEFSTEVGAWNYLGLRALYLKTFIPDFSATARPGTKLLKIHKVNFVHYTYNLYMQDENLYLPDELNWILSYVKSMPVATKNSLSTPGIPMAISMNDIDQYDVDSNPPASTGSVPANDIQQDVEEDKKEVKFNSLLAIEPDSIESFKLDDDEESKQSTATQPLVKKNAEDSTEASSPSQVVPRMRSRTGSLFMHHNNQEQLNSLVPKKSLTINTQPQLIFDNEPDSPIPSASNNDTSSTEELGEASSVVVDTAEVQEQPSVSANLFNIGLTRMSVDYNTTEGAPSTNPHDSQDLSSLLQNSNSS
mmetsp:Transcript_3213/g.4747  ORF Transcript_3213/g.4747 Transcript_3213/m.4747 type:complete len:779 (-) Transcript_3213:15-2351(-)